MSCGNCEKCSCPKDERQESLVVLHKVLARHCLTNEQKAIRQFLSKPAPQSWACGCMGCQPLPGQDPKLDYYSVKRTPVCSCAMAWVEEVEGRFYKINEHRSPDGITHTARDLGPVGGPYLCNEYGQPK